MKEPILLIFDVDGTLTDSAGLTRVALDLTALEFYGVEKATRGITAYGQTDKNIFEEMLKNNGISFDDLPAEFARFSQRYTQNLERLLAESHKPRLHNGIRELLERLVEEDNVFLALGTGSIELGARLKLRRHGVDHVFPVGGFADDSSERSELISAAYRRSCEHYGINFPLSRTWVIGDTPNDVICGRKLGANTIAVATGMSDMAELQSYTPTAIFPDFSDHFKFLQVVRVEIEPPRSLEDWKTAGVLDAEPDPL
jgi:phosphoglycolate phosphatase